MSKKININALISYTSWGLLPVFWALLKDLPASVVLANRIFWGCICLSPLVFIKQRSLRNLVWPGSKTVIKHIQPALYLSVNWGVYIYAVSHHYVLASSLGYFLSPIMYLIASAVLFDEKLNLAKKLSGIIGCLALLPLFISADLPTISIALLLAFTIVAYGISHKKRALDSFYSIYLESLILSPLALLFLFLANGSTLFMPVFNSDVLLLLILSGIVTAVPLVTFASAVNQLPMSSIAIYQYISPILQFILGTIYFHESIGINKWIAFALAWLAILVANSGLYSVPVRRTET